MAQFTISGERYGRHVSVTWTDGELSGDESTCGWIRQVAKMHEGRRVRPLVGPTTTHDHLSSPYSARVLIRLVFPGRTMQEGSLPLLPDVPPARPRVERGGPADGPQHRQR
jgi:hypothetical protein